MEYNDPPYKLHRFSIANFCKLPSTFWFPLYVVSAYDGHLQSRDITLINSPPQANAVEFYCYVCVLLLFFNVFFLF